MTLTDVMTVLDKFDIVQVVDHATGEVLGFCCEEYSVMEDVMDCEVMYMGCMAFDAAQDPEDKYPRCMGMTGLQIAIHYTDYERED